MKPATSSIISRLLKKIATGLLILTAIILLVYVLFALISTPLPEHPYFSEKELVVIAHRGGRGLAPENTMTAFDNAVRLGVDVLEMDIHQTADGVIVLIHDDTVDRTTNGTGPVSSFTFAELQQLDAGYHWTADDGATFPYRGQGVTISTLEEVFTAYPDMHMNIEIKDADTTMVEKFCQLLTTYNMEDKVLAGSFNTETNKNFRAKCPTVATITTEPEIKLFYVLNRLYISAAYLPSVQAFEVPEYSGDILVVDKRFVASARKHNMKVWVWTVNEKDDMQRILDLGVDGIITDYPDRLLEVLDR
jgi:glycerophosphoryl diester phosphodiesterase